MLVEISLSTTLLIILSKLILVSIIFISLLIKRLTNSKQKCYKYRIMPSSFIIIMKAIEDERLYKLKSLKENAMAITQQQLDNWFTYHSPSSSDQEGYVAIRTAAKILAETIIKHTPSSADQTASIRLLREAVMTANASIACKGQ